MKQYVFGWLLLAVNFISQVNAQSYNQQPSFLNYNKIWAWGKNAGYNFNNHSTFYSSMSSDEGAASVSDPLTGSLLFYSDGKTAWNRNHQPMSQANGNLLGNTTNGTTTQGVCIVPFINDPKKYYLFSLEPQGGFGLPGSRGRLYYSVIDMNLSNGLGNVIVAQRNILLDSLLGEAMVAVPGNNCDVWLIVHPTKVPVFKAFHITGAGIDPNPVISTTGNEIAGSVFTTQMFGGVPSVREWGAYMAGGMSVSPDRNKIAIASQIAGFGTLSSYQGLTQGTLVCDFDASSGMVSNAQLIDTFGCYNVAFSPDNSKLYVSSSEVNVMAQYDISNFNAASIIASKQNITGSQEVIRGLKLYNDTIYATSGGSTNGNPFVHRINNPNISGPGCNFQLNAISLGNNSTSKFMLPNEVVPAFAPDTIGYLTLDTLICEEWSRDLTLNAPAGYLSYLWSDGSTGTNFTATERGTYWVRSLDVCHSRIDTFKLGGAYVAFSLGDDSIVCNDIQPFDLTIDVPADNYQWQDGSTSPTYTVKDAGTYIATASKAGCSHTDTLNVIYLDLYQDLGKDTLVCFGEPFTLRLKANVPQGASVTWSTGATTPFISVNDTGIYSVLVTKGHCSGSGSRYIGDQRCSCMFGIPTAFTPNNDGKNDYFRPEWQADCPISGYQLRIYNRWGKEVFYSNDPRQGWDGTFNGTTTDVGIYFYEIKFFSGTHDNPYQQKGDLTLIR